MQWEANKPSSTCVYIPRAKSKSYTLLQQVGSVYKAGLIATVVASLLCFEMDRLALFVLFVVVGEVSSHHCKLFHCDPVTGLRKKTLISTTISYKRTSQCADPTHCDDSTPGTGHKLSSELTDDLIAVERCYSFCYTNVRVVPKELPLARYQCWMTA